MPLSSVLGAQSLVRPGVCTSSTRPASPFEGQLIFETDTNRVVAYDGSNWVYAVDTDQPPGLQLVKTQTIGSAVSSVTVSDAFSADFDNYIINVNGGSASAWAYMTLQLGSTTSGYYSAGYYSYYGSASLSSHRSNNSSNFAYVGSGITAGLCANITLFNPFLSRETTMSSVTQDINSAGGGFTTSGFLNNTTSYTAFTIAPGSGTYTGGTIRVYGYRNS